MSAITVNRSHVRLVSYYGTYTAYDGHQILP